MKELLFKSFVWAAGFTAVPMALAAISLVMTEPPPDAGNSDMHLGAIIDSAPYIFAFFFILLLLVGSLGLLYRRHSRGAP